jgi:hypothetical protein
MKTLNQLISDYTSHLQQGEIQLAYKGILEFMGKLRADFIKKYPQYDISNIYQGYMDMSYFSIFTNPLKEKGLKVALVYLHDKGHFEVWLSARNRDITKQYETVLKGKPLQGIPAFHDPTNLDAIVESVLVTAPDFEDQATLTLKLQQGVDNFIEAVNDSIMISV